MVGIARKSFLLWSLGKYSIIYPKKPSLSVKAPISGPIAKTLIDAADLMGTATLDAGGWICSNGQEGEPWMLQGLLKG